jgi:hypothetical protein
MSNTTSALLIALALTLAQTEESTPAAEPESESTAGEIPSFFLREVAGPQPNLAKCLVCRYGRRPVVMLCVRELDDATKALIEKIDALVDGHRGEGLRGFAIFIDAEPKVIQPKLFNLARDSKLSLPLALPVEPAGPSALALSKTAAVSVILYRDLKEQRRFELTHDDVTAERIEEISQAVSAMLDR